MGPSRRDTAHDRVAVAMIIRPSPDDEARAGLLLVYGKESMMLRYSSSVKALRVVVRMFPC